MRVKKSDLDRWRKHVEEGSKHPQSITAYCREMGIAPSSLHYWQRKLAKPKTLSVTATPSFVPVSVSRMEKELPDPKWLAQFVSEFLRRVQ